MKSIVCLFLISLSLFANDAAQSALEVVEEELSTLSLPPVAIQQPEPPVQEENFLFLVEEPLIIQGLIFSGPGDQVYFFPKCPVSCQGLAVPDPRNFCKKMAHFLGSPLTTEIVEEIRETAVCYYQKRGYFLTKVLLPKVQEINNGVVHFEIIEPRLGEISSIPPEWFSNDEIVNEFKIQEGDRFCWEDFRKDLDWVNSNPFHQTSLVFEEGRSADEVNLLIYTQDRFPVRAYGFYENTGNLLAGNSRYYSGVEWANLWNADHRLNYLFMSAGDFSRWWGQILNYIAPLPWRHRLDLFGSYVRSKLNERHGWGVQGIGKYQMPFYIGNSKQLASIGYAFKRSNNVFDFGEPIMHMYDISQFMAIYEAGWDKSIGRTNVTLTVVVSPGNMTPFNKKPDFTAIRTDASPHYVYGQLEIDQLFYCPGDFTWFTHLFFQQSSNHLLPSEEVSLGGYATIRGYEENEVIGDNGFLLKNEWRLPSWPLNKLKGTPQGLQFLLFCDLGFVYDVDSNILVANNTFLGSYGPGIRYHLGNLLSARFDYGWQIRTIDRLVDDASYRSHAHFGLTLAF